MHQLSTDGAVNPPTGVFAVVAAGYFYEKKK